MYKETILNYYSGTQMCLHVLGEIKNDIFQKIRSFCPLGIYASVSWESKIKQKIVLGLYAWLNAFIVSY